MNDQLVKANDSLRNEGIIFYGADWCGDSRRSRSLLDRLGVAYAYVDVDDDEEAADRVRQLNNGQRVTPTIVLPQGPVLVEPSDDDLTGALEAAGLLLRQTAAEAAD